MQVLLGLQSNALKFTKQGKVEINVKILELEQEEKKDKYLQISVIDTGIGIPYEDQDKLFKPFGFLEGTQLMNKNGVGLGLIISEGIVKKFGG